MKTIVLLLVLLSSENVQAQRKDSTKKVPDLINNLSLDFYTTLNGVHYEHGLEEDQRAQLYVYYNFTVNNRLHAKTFSLRTYIFNEYGLRHYFDSVSVKSADRYCLRNNLQVACWKRLSLSAGIELKSQLWKTWLYRENAAGELNRYLYSDHNSPGYTLYSFGGSLRLQDDVTLDIGIVSGKITRMRNKLIYRERGLKKLYGMEESEDRKAEWGLSMQVSVPPRKVGRHFCWEFAGTLFAPRKGTGRLKSYTADVNNVIHYIFFRHMRLTFRTQLRYDEVVQEKTFLMNHISLGFYLNNRI